MRLHEAIRKVLEKSETPLDAVGIANVINSFNICQHADDSIVTSADILSEAAGYECLFTISDKTIILMS